MTLPSRIWTLACLCTGSLLASAVLAQEPDSLPDGQGDELQTDGSGVEEGSGDTARESTPEGSGPANEMPAYDPAAPPWQSIENSVIIPEVDTSEDAEWLLVDEELVPTGNPTWLRAVGHGQVGVAASQRDRAGVILGGGVGLARLSEPTTDTQTLHGSSESWFWLSGLVELGTSAAADAVPFVQADVFGPRLNRDDRDDGVGTLTFRRDTLWGVARLRRNMRVQRGVRSEVALGAIQLRTVWFERTNVATIIHVSADMPGWAYVSPQGRSGAFHGLNFTRVSADFGPRFGASAGPWARFLIGGEASVAAGVASGPFGTVRTDLGTWVGVDVHAHDHLMVRLQLAMDFARDTHRSLSDSAWRGGLTLVSRF